MFAIGIRNSFGMAFDPVSGDLWEQENGDDTFDEINRVERGMNGGWVQLAGPIDRVAQFREMETTFGGRSLQQLRWHPTNIADNTDDPRLGDDRVADNNAKNDITESESLLAGRSFGIVTDIQTGPDGHLYAVSTNRGTIYEIFPR